MDLAYTPEAEEFRVEIREWLSTNLPSGWGDDDFEMTPDERKQFNEQWPKKLFAGGWICATWPKEYGGKGLTTMQGVVLAEEFARAKAPMRADFFGDTLVGPTILQWGTEEQKKEFLPRILNGSVRWCQGFSEPNSGSDLASLKTSAVLDGDEWVINGQKVWTTGGHHADYCFLLTRTDPEAPKHKGISYLLVPMRQPGVEVRGITQPDGTAEFCEVFFTDARCPRDNVVGGVNNGWKVANSTLAFERGQSATTGTLIRVFATFVTVILSIGAVFGAMNTMYAAVAYRTREIGTLRALGFSQFRIVTAFLAESIALALVGGVIGCILALPVHGLSTGTTNFSSFTEVAFKFRITPALMVGGLVFSVVMGAVGGLLPALRAARIPVARALREI